MPRYAFTTDSVEFAVQSSLPEKDLLARMEQRQTFLKAEGISSPSAFLARTFSAQEKAPDSATPTR